MAVFCTESARRADGADSKGAEYWRNASRLSSKKHRSAKSAGRFPVDAPARFAYLSALAFANGGVAKWEGRALQKPYE